MNKERVSQIEDDNQSDEVNKLTVECETKVSIEENSAKSEGIYKANQLVFSQVDITTLPTGSEALGVEFESAWEFSEFVPRNSLVKIVADSPEDATRLVIYMASQAAGEMIFDRFKKERETKSIYMNGGSTYKDILLNLKLYGDSRYLDSVSIGSRDWLKKNNDVELDLSSKEWRDMILRSARKNKDQIVFLDNVGNLFSDKSNESEYVDWAYSLKATGVSMVAVFPKKYQANVLADDYFDISISLKKLVSLELSFQIDFNFAKNMKKPQCKPYIIDHVTKDGQMTFTARALKDDLVAKVALFSVKGFTQAEIARILGVHQSTISRRFDDALNLGYVEKHGRVFTLTEEGEGATRNIEIPDA